MTDNTDLYPYLKTLNESQRQAVLKTDGAVLVLAGAGTGKTRALTTRLGHILNTRTALPGQILAVTFTNKAAQEMKERVSSMLGGMDVGHWWIGTFHSLCAKILRSHAPLVGLTSNFTIIDTDDQIRLMKQIMQSHGMDTKQHSPNAVMGMVERWKDKAQNPADVKHEHSGDLAGGRVAFLYGEYQERLRSLNACDFGDLILHVITIFKDTANGVLDQYHHRFTHILVDEYQDTNVAQYLWLRLLAQKKGNICCVGDDDQSIYGWRGAEVGNILRFEKDFKNAEIIRLEQNYRSTPNILEAANGVIANNASRLGKNLWTDKDKGEKVQLNGVWDGAQEARMVTDQIERLKRNSIPYNEMAVLVRASFQMREFEERLNYCGLPYRVIGGARFYERMEIRDAIAYLRTVFSDTDDLAFERIINTPKRSIGDKTVRDIATFGRTNNLSLFQASKQMVGDGSLRPAVRTALGDLLAQFDRWKDLRDDINHVDLADTVLNESGYITMWQNDKSVEAKGRLENLKELLTAMGEFESLDEFLEHIALVMENQEKNDGDRITLMTMHGAKGLEFHAVFLPGWEEGLFPSQRSMDEKGMEGLEEERRLAYVAITRARKFCHISHAANRRMYGSWVSSIPSRFIGELPEGPIEIGVDGQLSAGYTHHNQHNDNTSSSFGARFKQRSSFNGNGREEAVHFVQASPSVNTFTSEGGYKKGERVFHEKFGSGLVISVENDRLEISFDKAGRKKILDRFVKPLGKAQVQ